MTTAAKKSRLDALLVERGLAATPDQAQRLIMAGEVFVDGARRDKPGQSVPSDAVLTVRAARRYVSRGGLKLAAALGAFALDVAGLVAVDVGASTGGFTDCLLQHGAARVYAIDVGYGQLAWKLQTDARVVMLDRTNVRQLAALPDGALADLAVIDASFIGLAQVLPATLRLLQPGGQVIALVKPQFEAEAALVASGGVVRDPAVHRQVLAELCAHAGAWGLTVGGLTVSPAPGPAGNVEFLLWLRRAAQPAAQFDLERAIDDALAAAQLLRGSAGQAPLA